MEKRTYGDGFIRATGGAADSRSAAAFDRALHQRLNRRLLAGQLLDLAVRGFGSRCGIWPGPEWAF